jgi:WD40 repeat protein
MKILFLLFFSTQILADIEPVLEFGKSSKPCAGPITRLNPTRDFEFIATDNGDVSVWDVRRGRKLSEWSSRLNRILDARIFYDANSILLAGDGGVELYELATGALLQSLDYIFGITETTYTNLGASHDGRLVAASALTGWPHYFTSATEIGINQNILEDALRPQKQVIKIWELRTGRLLASLALNDSLIRSVNFSANGKHLIVTTFDQVLFLSAKDLSLFKRIQLKNLESSPQNIIVSVAHSLDLRRMAISTLNHLLIVDTKNVRVERKLKHFPGIHLIRHLTISEDNQRLLGTDLQGRYYLWNLADGSYVSSGSYLLDHQSQTIFVSSSGGPSQPVFEVDRKLRFVVVPGRISSEAFGQCPGYQVLKTAGEF